MAKRGLKVAKADKDEFDRVWNFVHAMNALFEGRGFFSSEEDWRDWPDDDEDKQELLKIEKDIIDSEGDCNDNRLVLYEYMKRKFLKANYSGSFGRILFDCQTLIDNCCDPDLDYLEFKPSIKYAELNAFEKIEKIVEKCVEEGQLADDILSVIRKEIEDFKKEDE